MVQMDFWECKEKIKQVIIDIAISKQQKNSLFHTFYKLPRKLPKNVHGVEFHISMLKNNSFIFGF